MANDRVYIVCECGEKILLMKYYPHHSYVYHPERLEDYLIEHLNQCGEAGSKIEKLPYVLMTETEMD